MGHPWVPMGRFFCEAHGLGWATFEEKTMGGLGQSSTNPWVDFGSPAQPIRTSDRYVIESNCNRRKRQIKFILA